MQEDFYKVRIPFDGELILAEASFVDTTIILIGTRLIRDYVLTIDFPESTLQLVR